MIIATRTTGYRTILNTNHAVVSIVSREGPRTWRLTSNICMGIAGGVTDYKTKREALAALNA